MFYTIIWLHKTIYTFSFWLSLNQFNQAWICVLWVFCVLLFSCLSQSIRCLVIRDNLLCFPQLWILCWFISFMVLDDYHHLYVLYCFIKFTSHMKSDSFSVSFNHSYWVQNMLKYGLKYTVTQIYITDLISNKASSQKYEN